MDSRKGGGGGGNIGGPESRYDANIQMQKGPVDRATKSTRIRGRFLELDVTKKLERTGADRRRFWGGLKGDRARNAQESGKGCERRRKE